ncbi:unnamed protein product [Ilex paraguariensis]|uniref:Uncharacterized protein n=1 Tax=Ilex paraguariensis TaxID=185542 RepID=A0ABC8TF58_9AQUA
MVEKLMEDIQGIKCIHHIQQLFFGADFDAMVGDNFENQLDQKPYKKDVDLFCLLPMSCIIDSLILTDKAAKYLWDLKSVADES